MLPQTLLCLLSAALAVSQSLKQLPLDQVSVISPQNLPTPPIFSIPSGNNLSISLALCSDFQSTNSPTFTLKNSTNSPGTDLVLSSNGLTIWTGWVTDGATLQVNNLGGMNFEIGISNDGPLHQILPEYPLFGDTTSNQALIFSPVFMNASLPQPSYPNYSLPQANLPFPDPPPNSQTPNISLIFAPTSATRPLIQIPQTGCRLNSVAPPAGTNSTPRSWLHDEQGWRMQFLVEGLTPSTNYTAYVVQSGTRVSGPMHFVTKSSSFPCFLLHSLPFCPSTSYSVPLPPPPSGSTFYDGTTLPSNLTTTLISYLTNFTTTLGTFPCGRDVYSPLQTCADCERAYRKWLCSISFPRCAELPPAPSTPIAQVPLLPALVNVPAGNSSRNSFARPLNTQYNALLPCIEVCTAVDRACPPLLQWLCPSPKHNANLSYGVGYVDSGEKGEEGGGIPGVAQDRFGNVWCNPS